MRMCLITLWTSIGRKRAEQITSLLCQLLLLQLRKPRSRKPTITTLDQAYHQLSIYQNISGRYLSSRQGTFRLYLLQELPREDDRNTIANIHHLRQ